MHRWESQEKLLAEWEALKAQNGIDYSDFEYKRNEFDNVPPVVPRFLLYLQVSLKPIIAHLQSEMKK